MNQGLEDVSCAGLYGTPRPKEQRHRKEEIWRQNAMHHIHWFSELIVAKILDNHVGVPYQIVYKFNINQ